VLCLHDAASGALLEERVPDHVFGGVGLAFQDAVAAWAIYRAARRAGVGREIDFLA
jgi:ornithine cyclodeaminase/alanine dehydrogenase-like protein (mu-crystallin family)